MLGDKGRLVPLGQHRVIARGRVSGTRTIATMGAVSTTSYACAATARVRSLDAQYIRSMAARIARQGEDSIAAMNWIAGASGAARRREWDNSAPVKTTAEWEAGEVPETFPFAV